MKLLLIFLFGGLLLFMTYALAQFAVLVLLGVASLFTGAPV